MLGAYVFQEVFKTHHFKLQEVHRRDRSDDLLCADTQSVTHTRESGLCRCLSGRSCHGKAVFLIFVLVNLIKATKANVLDLY